MIKLYNNSKISDILFIKMIKHAMKQLSLKGDVIVLITKGKRGGGTFWKGYGFRDSRFGSMHRIKSELGKIEITPYLIADPLICAKEIYECIMHEFKHSFDWVNKTVSFNRRDATGKRFQYAKRPCEISARFFEKYQAQYDDGILLDLAIEIEMLQKKGKG